MVALCPCAWTTTCRLVLMDAIHHDDFAVDHFYYGCNRCEVKQVMERVDN